MPSLKDFLYYSKTLLVISCFNGNITIFHLSHYVWTYLQFLLNWTCLLLSLPLIVWHFLSNVEVKGYFFMLSKIIQWDVIKPLLLHISKCFDPMFQNMQTVLESVSDAIRVIFACSSHKFCKCKSLNTFPTHYQVMISMIDTLLCLVML